MQLREDTIVALSTPPGRGAIAVVRLSGEHAHDIARRIAQPFPGTARQAQLAVLADPTTNATIDRAIVTRFDAPRSYSGEAMVEFACHGGSAIVAALLETCVAAGARQASAGEFTQRAVLNGKLDLLQAEAVADLIDASTREGQRLALSQLDGGLSRLIADLRGQLLNVEALLAYDIDFPEEDDGPIRPERVLEAVTYCRATIDTLLRTAPLAEIAKDGACVVIAGPPNAGKSSLFNALLGQARAIVTDIPGTTRDAIEARVENGRWPLRLFDTAGIRDSDDRLEQLGIEVSKRHIQQAHLVLACADSVAELTTTAASVGSMTAVPVVRVLTKADQLPAGAHLDGALPVSAVRRSGLDDLLAAIAAQLELALGTLPDDRPAVTRTRHRVALERAQTELEDFVGAWEQEQLPATIAAVHVRAACHALDELVGTIDVEDVLTRVFSSFCVGK